MLVVLSLSAIAMAKSAAPAYAQCSVSGDVARAISEAESVFMGRVSAINLDGRIAQMRVDSIWKGRDFGGVVEVRGASQPDAAPSSSDRRFELGASYLVIPENSRPPFLATACSATHSATAVGQLIPLPYQDAVGTSQGRAPASIREDGEAALVASVLPMVAIIAMIIAALALVTRIRSRQPERVPSTPKPPKPRRLKRRDLARDAATSVTVAQKLVKKNKRRWKTFRRRQDRQLASSSRKAMGSTETS